MVESFIDAHDGLATQSQAQMKLMFLEIGTSVKSKFNRNFSALNQRRCRKKPALEFEDGCIDDEEEQDVSTEILQKQRNHFIDLQDH